MHAERMNVGMLFQHLSPATEMNFQIAFNLGSYTRAPALDVGLSTPTQYDYFDVWGHPLMTSKKIRFSTHLRPCPHASTWAGPPPPPLWPSPRSRHEIHPAVLKRLIQ